MRARKISSERAFDGSTCDLCGSTDYSVLLDLPTGRAMRSDRHVIKHDLRKVACKRCGLVRSGSSFDSLEEMYRQDYTLSVQTGEHYFYTDRGPLSRSALLCDWLADSAGSRWWRASRCLEVGAGCGMLLEQLSSRFDDKSFAGIELSKTAAAVAQSRGLPVKEGGLDELCGLQYDLIYAVAVIEHVPSPAEFLRALRNLLVPGGVLLLCQPTQDVPSYDLFFADHLHHFGTEHLSGYAQKCGFCELELCVGHEWMPNFSLHVWQVVGEPETLRWEGRPGYTTCSTTAHEVLASVSRLNDKLEEVARTGQPVAVFGLNEVYCLFRAYSRLGELPIVCGMDDAPEKEEYKQLGFPVVRPEDSIRFRINDVLLTMNKIYYPEASRRLERLGLVPYRIW